MTEICVCRLKTKEKYTNSFTLFLFFLPFDSFILSYFLFFFSNSASIHVPAFLFHSLSWSFPISFKLDSTFFHVLSFHLLPSLSFFLTPFTFILLFFIHFFTICSQLFLILPLSIFIQFPSSFSLCHDLCDSLSRLPLHIFTLLLSFILSLISLFLLLAISASILYFSSLLRDSHPIFPFLVLIYF